MTQQTAKAKKTNKGFTILLTVESILAVAALFFCSSGVLDKMQPPLVFDASADMVCILISVFIQMGTMYGRKNMGRQFGIFLGLVIANYFALLFDLLGWTLDGIPQIRGFLLFVNTGIFILNQVQATLFVRFIAEFLVPEEKRHKGMLLFMDVVLVITILLRLVNLKYGFYFTVDENGVFHGGPYEFLVYVYPLMALAMAVYMVFRYSKDVWQRRTMLAFTLVPFVAIMLSMFIYGFFTIYPCVLLSIVTAYTAFCREIDEDTGKLRDMFGRYVSEDVVEQLEKNEGTDVPGKRYYATFFVSDMRGFTALAEKMEPQPLVEMLNHYFGVAAEIIADYGGIITEFLGDGILCVFGAPTPAEDHAERCVAAALRLQEEMPEINKWNKEHGFPELETGIGINTGSVIMGSLGSEARARYMAVGEDVDRAFAIEGCSLGGQVLASGATVKAIRSPLELRFLINYSEDSDGLIKTPIYDVRHIGDPWNVGRKRDYEPQRPVKEPIEIEYYAVNGKHTDVTPHPVKILKLSKDVAVFTNDGRLEPLDNLKLEIPDFGTIFAKVTSIRPDTVMIAFTSRPAGFAEWAASVTQPEEPKYGAQ